MGVTNLWEVLREVKTDVTLDEIKGQTLAVDLATWICESEGVKNMQNYVARPYIRNLFFRVSNVLKADINLVFVLDGKAPELKWETISKRLAGSGGSPKKTSSGVRSRLNAKLKECCVLLDSLGVPWIKAEGEAEALCAALNKIGLVDGVVTSDGDCFLYGARTVYRNFSVEKQVPIERYCIEDIERSLQLNQRELIALGLLLGCDYCPKGVPGVGTAQAVKLLSGFEGQDSLNVFMIWRKSGRNLSSCEFAKKQMHCSTCGHEGSKKVHSRDGCDTCGIACSTIAATKIVRTVPCDCQWHKEEDKRKKYALEEKIRTAALKDSRFPDPDIIKEFLKSQKYVTPGKPHAVDPSQDLMLKDRFILKPPILDIACRYLGQKLEWEVSYSLGKVLPLATHFILNSSMVDVTPYNRAQQVIIHSVVRTRVKDRVPSFEIKWMLTDKVDLEVGPDTDLVTIESEESTKIFYPDIVESFYERVEQEKEEKKKAKAEARKLERRKQKGSPTKSKPSAAQTKKMTDFFRAKKTRNEEKHSNTEAEVTGETSTIRRGKTEVTELQFSLASLSLSKKATNEGVTSCVSPSVCAVSTQNIDEIDVCGGDYSISKTSSKRKEFHNFPVIVFSSDSDESDFEIDDIAKKLGNMGLDKKSERRVKASPLSDRSNASSTDCLHHAILESDVTFSSELDFSLGCSLLSTPVAHTKENISSFNVKSPTIKRIDILMEKKPIMKEKNINETTPEKTRRTRSVAVEDSPVFMTLMQRLKLQKNK